MDVKTMASMGRAARDAKYDAATLVAWEMRGGPKRKKNAVYRPMEVMSSARKIFDKLQARMQKVGIADQDSFVAVVWSDKNYTELLNMSLIQRTETPDADDLEQLGKLWNVKHAIPMGYVGGIFSKETKTYVTFARPLVVDNPDATKRLLEKALDMVQLSRMSKKEAE
jgi:hypothetical protein